MATATKVNADIFNCPICLEVIRSPKSLPCLHSFCEQCISKFICEADRKQEDKISTYQCPVCRTVVTPTSPEVDVSKWASLLPTNFSLTTMMNSASGKEKQECHSCKRRGKSTEGLMWCRDCNEAFCQICSEVHGSIKFTMDHKVIEIGTADANLQIVDVNAISQACPIHNYNLIVAFCLDHKKVCCVLCLTLRHKKCDNVKTIEDVSEKVKTDSPSIMEVTDTLQSTIGYYITRKQQQIEHFEGSTKQCEAKAKRYVACAKDKLDTLFISFTKELSLLEDDKKAKFDGELGVLNQLSKQACHLSKVSTVVGEHGTAVQQLISTENIKTQIADNILPAIFEIDVQQNIEVVLKMDSKMQHIEHATRLGKMKTALFPNKSETEDIEDGTVNLSFIEKFVSRFEAKYKRFITLPNSSYTCGVCVNENIIICGDESSGYLRAMEINSGSQVSSICYGYSKCIAIDRQRNELYVSYKDGVFAKINFQVDSRKFTNVLNFKSGLIGGIDIFENHLYMIQGNTVKKSRLDVFKSAASLTQCFVVNTECSNNCLNSLVIDPNTGRIIYTSKDNEVVCTTLEGKQVFCFKNEKIKKPTSLVVHSSSVILVGSETGSVYALSSNGKRYWTVIEKCKSIKKLCDIWMDTSEKVLFLCGNNYLEMYDIVI